MSPILSSDMNEKNGALEFDYTFPHSYEVQEVRELPGTGGLGTPLFYIPEPKSRTEHDGLWLQNSVRCGQAMELENSLDSRHV